MKWEQKHTQRGETRPRPPLPRQGRDQLFSRMPPQPPVPAGRTFLQIFEAVMILKIAGCLIYSLLQGAHKPPPLEGGSAEVMRGIQGFRLGPSHSWRDSAGVLASSAWRALCWCTLSAGGALPRLRGCDFPQVLSPAFSLVGWQGCCVLWAVLGRFLGFQGGPVRCHGDHVQNGEMGNGVVGSGTAQPHTGGHGVELGISAPVTAPPRGPARGQSRWPSTCAKGEFLNSVF